MNRSQKKVAKAMQVNYFKKYHKIITLEVALEKVYELLEWYRIEGKEFQRVNPVESKRIADNILKDKRNKSNLKN